VLFAATGFVLVIDAWILLRGVQALGAGAAAWQAYLEALAWPPTVLGVFLLLVGTVFFSLRWLRVGVKVASVPLGALPPAPAPVVALGHFAGFALITSLLLLVLAGVIL
jgi:fumarate reductase subunit C